MNARKAIESRRMGFILSPRPAPRVSTTFRSTDGAEMTASAMQPFSRKGAAAAARPASIQTVNYRQPETTRDSNTINTCPTASAYSLALRCRTRLFLRLIAEHRTGNLAVVVRELAG